MTIDKRINYRVGGASGREYDRPSAPSPSTTRSSPFSGNEGRQQYSATQTQTGAVKGGGPRGTTSFVSGDRGRDSRDEFIRNVQKTNPGYRPGPPRNNFFSRTIGAGLDYARRNPQNIALGLIDPSFGALSGIFSFLNSPEMRKKLTGYETQAEYEQARQDRINRKRISTLENTIQKKYLDKGRSLDETELDERLASLKAGMGIQDTAPNVMTGRDLNLRGIESLNFGDTTVPGSSYDMAGVLTPFAQPAPEEFVSKFLPDTDIFNQQTTSYQKRPEEVETDIFFRPQIKPEEGGILDLEIPGFTVEDKYVDALTFPTDDGSGISLMDRSILRNAGYNDNQIKEAFDKGYGEQLIRDIQGPIGGSAFG